MTQHDYLRYVPLCLKGCEDLVNAVVEDVRDWPKLTADEKEKVIEALKACPLWYVRTRMPYVYIANGVATVLK
jgi:hypothetical protein